MKTTTGTASRPTGGNLLRPGTRVVPNEHAEASIRGTTGVVRPGTTLQTAVVELWTADGGWVETRRIPSGHLAGLGPAIDNTVIKARSQFGEIEYMPRSVFEEHYKGLGWYYAGDDDRGTPAADRQASAPSDKDVASNGTAAPITTGATSVDNAPYQVDQYAVVRRGLQTWQGWITRCTETELELSFWSSWHATAPRPTDGIAPITISLSQDTVVTIDNDN